MESHDAANIFPLDDESLPELAADIRQNGLQVPIELFGGKIIDGRRRYAACQAAGVTPKFRDVQTIDPVAYVLSLNLHRRHLTKSQMSMVGARAREIYDVQAKERQRTHGGTAPGKAKTLPVKTPEVKGEAREFVGRMVGVGGTSIDMASRVLEDGVPELVKAVDEGQIKVYPAARIAALPPEEQKEEVEKAKTQPAARPEPAGAKDRDEPDAKSKSDALLKANEAIQILMRIPKNNLYRSRAFQVVTDWIRTHKG